MKHQFKKTRKTNLIILVKHFDDGVLNFYTSICFPFNLKVLFCYAIMNLNISNIEYKGNNKITELGTILVANEDLVNPGDVLAGMLSLISLFI